MLNNERKFLCGKTLQNKFLTVIFREMERRIEKKGGKREKQGVRRLVTTQAVCIARRQKEKLFFFFRGIERIKSMEDIFTNCQLLFQDIKEICGILMEGDELQLCP